MCAECPPGTYENWYYNVCQPCHENCYTCDAPTDADDAGEENECFECNRNAFDTDRRLGDAEDRSNSIHSAFNSGEEVDSEATAERKLQTIECYSLSDNNACMYSEWPDYVNQECNPCHTDCGSCSGPSEYECTTCGGGNCMHPNGLQCVGACPAGYYCETSGDDECETCDSDCRTCDDSDDNDCTSCSGNRYL